MEKSFIFVDKDDKPDMPIGGASFSTTIKRLEFINAICDGTENSYKTEYPHIVKLCRLCIQDICKELTERANFETECFKRYSKMHRELLEGKRSELYTDDLVKDLEHNKINAKYQYTQYSTLYQELKKKQLYTKACAVCTEINQTK